MSKDVKVIVINDLHYDKRIHKGVDESRAWECLLSIVDYHRLDLVLSCGDRSPTISFEELYGLFRKTIVLSIYGDHENMDVLTRLRNVKSSLPIIMEDGRVYELRSLRIAVIRDIISVRHRLRKGVPRKHLRNFLKAAEKLRGKGNDILLIHETPYLPELFPFMRGRLRFEKRLRSC